MTIIGCFESAVRPRGRVRKASISNLKSAATNVKFWTGAMSTPASASLLRFVICRFVGTAAAVAAPFFAVVALGAGSRTYNCARSAGLAKV